MRAKAPEDGSINILPGMVSLYEWQGAREEAAEAVLIAKTSATGAAAVREFLEREHPYEVPAILTLPLADVNAAYRDWLMQGIGGNGGSFATSEEESSQGSATVLKVEDS